MSIEGDLALADDNGIVFLNPQDAEELLPTLSLRKRLKKFYGASFGGNR